MAGRYVRDSGVEEMQRAQRVGEAGAKPNESGIDGGGRGLTVKVIKNENDSSKLRSHQRAWAIPV